MIIHTCIHVSIYIIYASMVTRIYYYHDCTCFSTTFMYMYLSQYTCAACTPVCTYHTHTHTRTCMHIRTVCPHTYIHAYTLMHIYTHVHVYICVCTYRLHHEVEVSTGFTHRGPEAQGCVNLVETEQSDVTDLYHGLVCFSR